METRVVLLGIIVEDTASVEISALSGKIGMLPGVSAKALYAKTQA